MDDTPSPPPRQYKSNRASRHAVCVLRLVIVARIELLRALGADAVREFRLRVFADIGLDLAPVPLVVAHLLAGGADRQETPQGPDAGKRLFFLLFGVVSFVLQFHPLRDV